jgi:hypothetical protein
MASLAPLSDLYPPPRRRRAHPLVALGVALAVLQQDLARAELERRRMIDMLPELMLTPFGPALGIDAALTEAEDVQRYDHDEDGDDDGTA